MTLDWVEAAIGFCELIDGAVAPRRAGPGQERKFEIVRIFILNVCVSSSYRSSLATRPSIKIELRGQSQRLNNRAQISRLEDTSSRKLAVILHADVVGSTPLVQLNEKFAHKRIQDAITRLSETISNHGGIAHEIRGDALVAEFAKASDAVSASLAFQTANDAHNNKLSDDIRPVARIGIAMGEVVVADNTVTGEGVVLAQRLEQIAGPGGVVIQGAAYETIPKRLPFEYKNLGERQIKGFDESVRMYTVRKSELEKPAEPAMTASEFTEKPSIAVLPFTNMSGEPEQEYFSDGVTEDIITELSHFKALSVIARNSSFAFKGRSVDVAEVFKQLSARYVVEGSVRKAGNQVRVTAQLIESESREHVWAQRYDRDLSDIFQVQDEITKLIVAAVAGRVDAAESQRAAMKPPRDMSTYDLFLRGIHEFDKTESSSDVSCEKARALFRQAIDSDPRFARAYTYHAFSIFCDVWFLVIDRSHLDEALDMAEKAMAFAPDDAFALATHGLILCMLGRGNEGVAELERSLERNPNDAVVLHYFGFVLSNFERASEGVGYIREAIRLNPFNRYWDNSLGIALSLNGQYEQAVKVNGKYVGTEWKWTIACLAADYAQLGQLDEAHRLGLRVAALQEQRLNKQGEPVPASPLAAIEDDLKKSLPEEFAFSRHVIDGLRKAGLTYAQYT